MIKSMTRALMRLSDRDSHKAALAAGGLLVAASAATWSVLAVVHSSMAWRQTLLRGTSRVGVALPRANPQPTPAGRDGERGILGEGCRDCYRPVRRRSQSSTVARVDASAVPRRRCSRRCAMARRYSGCLLYTSDAADE